MAGTEDLRYAYAELCAARPRYAKAEAYFDGDVDEIFASAKVAKMLAKSGLDELDEINFARLAVTAVTNRLHISTITAGDTEADADIADLTTRNELDEELPTLHVRACSMGDAYLMVWPELNADGDVENVGMYVNGPATVRVIYDAENPLRKAFAIKSWRTGQGKEQTTRADLYYPDRVERWMWQGKHGGRADKWEPYTGDGQDARLPNPCGDVPFFHYRTSRPYGRPEHYAAYGPQAIINKLVVSHVGTVDFQSLPQRYGLLDPALDQSGMQADFDPDNPEDAAGDPESPLNPSQLRNDPGEMWLLQGLKGVGQFTAADPEVYLKPIDRYIKAMAAVTETPMDLFDSTGAAISGESRREAKEPLTAKVKDRQRSFGATHAAAFAFALRLLGHDDVTVDVRWHSAQQINDADGWATIRAKIDSGVPRERALVEAGYPLELVRAWLTDLDDDAELQRRVELLAGLGEAIQRLGSGVALGAVTEAQVAALLDGVLAATARTGEDLVAGG